MKTNIFLLHLLLWLAFVCNPKSVTAQIYCKTTAAYSIREGLSDRTVFDIKRDSLGYLWIGTAGGLNRFDGRQFLTFESIGNPQIASSRIERIEVLDKYRLLLIPSALSSVCYIFHTNTFESNQLTLPSGAAILSVDRNGGVWTLSRIGREIVVYQFNNQQSFVEKYRVSCDDAFPAYFAGTKRLIIDNQGKHIIHTGDKTWMITDGRGSVLSTFTSETEGDILSSAIDGTGRIWLCFNFTQGVYNVDVINGKLIKNPRVYQQSYVLNIWSDRMGNIVFSEKEARKYYVKSMIGLRITTSELVNFNPIVEKENRITSICADDFFEYMYLGSHIGLFNVSTSKPAICNLQKTDIPLGRFGTIVRGITRGLDGKLYFTKESHDWFMYDPATGKDDTLKLIDETNGKRLYPNCNLSLTTDKSGNIWGASCETDEYQHGLLLRYNPKTGKVKSYDCPESGSMNVVLCDPVANGLWLVLYDETFGTKLLYFNIREEKYVNHSQRFQPELFSKTRPNALRYVDNNVLLLATDKGLVKLDLLRNTAQALLTGVEDGALAIMAMEPMKNGWWLLGTEGRGLVIFDMPNNKVERTFTKTDGLPNNWICSIAPDDAGRYWLGTFYGVSCFDPQTYDFRNFHTQDGLSDNEMNRRAQYTDPADNMYYFGSMNGLNFFRPNELMRQPANNNGHIVITQISYYDRKTGKIIEAVKGADNLTQIELPSNNRFFSLNAALTDLKAPDQHRLEFRIIGLHDYQEWKGLEFNQRIRFDYLPAGDYTLQIRAQNHNGVYTQVEKNIHIHVAEYLYKRPWFIALMVISLATVFYSAYLYRVRELLRINRLRNNISSDLHDEVGGVLAGIAMQADLLESAVDERFKPWVNRISTNCRKAAATMRDIVWSIDSRRDTFGDLILRMKDFAAETLSISDIVTEWDVRINNEKEKLPSHIRHHIYLIYKELVTNCLKHSGASSVYIRLERRRGTLYFYFKDNGSGFDTQQPFSGMGVSNIVMRAQRMNARYGFINHTGTGFELLVPLY